MTSLIIHQPAELASLAQSAERARGYAEQASASSTKRAYSHDWRHFTTWADARGLASLPAEPATVAMYISDLAELYTVSTITRRLAAISQAHQLSGLPSPTKDARVSKVLKGIKHKLHTAQRGKAPATIEALRAMVEHLPAGILGQRDRSLLLLGFAGAFRRSELVSLDTADIQITKQGAKILLRRSKTDQEGAGATKGIPFGLYPDTCPVRSLQAWLAAANIASGPIFRPIDRHGNVRPSRLTSDAVARIVKRAAGAAGLQAGEFAGHSLRAGLATSAAAAGVSERSIMKQTGHKSVQMVRRYIRDGDLFRDNASGQVGL